jgi:hypothetical protein
LWRTPGVTPGVRRFQSLLAVSMRKYCREGVWSRGTDDLFDVLRNAIYALNKMKHDRIAFRFANTVIDRASTRLI